MKRKVIQLAGKTLVVSLPSKWAKKYGIKKGDEVEVEEDGSRLFLGASVSLPKKEVTVNIKSSEDYLERMICAPYVKGYDSMTIRYDDPKVYEKVLATSKKLLGFEVVSSNKGSCRLANISSKLEENFNILLARLFVNGTQFAIELLERGKQTHTVSFEGLLEYEHNANRIALFCRRVIQKGGVGQHRYSDSTLYSIVSHLEEVVDILRDIAEKAKNSPCRFSNLNITLLNKATELQEINFSIFSSIIKGSDIDSQIGRFKEHRQYRQEIRKMGEVSGEKGVNAYISAKILHLCELSHHISEELFY